MSKQMEKLVEEIYLDLISVSWAFQRRDAEEFIARIGKAYADGLELPGEVGRETFSEFAQVGWMVVKYEEGARTFIALREEKKK